MYGHCHFAHSSWCNEASTCQAAGSSFVNRRQVVSLSTYFALIPHLTFCSSAVIFGCLGNHLWTKHESWTNMFLSVQRIYPNNRKTNLCITLIVWKHSVACISCLMSYAHCHSDRHCFFFFFNSERHGWLDRVIKPVSSNFVENKINKQNKINK